MSDATHEAEQLGRQAENSAWLDVVARIGLVAYGIVHLLVGWLALQLAFGHTNKDPSTTGALHELAHQPFGIVVVWSLAAGILLLAVWRALEAGFGYRDKEGGKRLRKRLAAAGTAVVYLAVGVSAVKIALGSGPSSDNQSSKDATARLMDVPAGQWLVVVVGLVIVGVGIGLIYRGWTDKFAEQLDDSALTGASGTAYLMLGKIGHLSKGVAIGVVGGLFVYAGLSHDPNKSGGLDQALQKVLQAPGGPAALVVIAFGFVCYGLYCFARSRHLDR